MITAPRWFDSIRVDQSSGPKCCGGTTGCGPVRAGFDSPWPLHHWIALAADEVLAPYPFRASGRLRPLRPRDERPIGDRQRAADQRAIFRAQGKTACRLLGVPEWERASRSSPTRACGVVATHFRDMEGLQVRFLPRPPIFAGVVQWQGTSPVRMRRGSDSRRRLQNKSGRIRAPAGLVIAGCPASPACPHQA